MTDSMPVFGRRRREEIASLAASTPVPVPAAQVLGDAAEITPYSAGYRRFRSRRNRGAA